MFRGFFNRIKQRKMLSASKYSKSLARYRKEHPESLAEEREHVYQWVRLMTRNREQIQVDEKERPLSDELKRAWAHYLLWETARAAFMSHPSATESEFLKCWPSLRAELLKQHALEGLAGNAIPLLEETDSDEIFGTEKPYFSDLQH